MLATKTHPRNHHRPKGRPTCTCPGISAVTVAIPVVKFGVVFPAIPQSQMIHYCIIGMLVFECSWQCIFFRNISMACPDLQLIHLRYPSESIGKPYHWYVQNPAPLDWRSLALFTSACALDAFPTYSIFTPVTGRDVHLQHGCVWSRPLHISSYTNICFCIQFSQNYG